MKSEKILFDYTKFVHFTINQKYKSEIFIKSQIENIVEKTFPFDSKKYNYKIVKAKKLKYLIIWNVNEKIQKNKKYYSPLIILRSFYPDKNLIYFSEKYFIEFANNEIQSPQSIEFLETYVNKIQNKDSYLFYADKSFNNKNLNIPILSIDSVLTKRNLLSIKLCRKKYTVFFNFIFLILIFIFSLIDFGVLKKNKIVKSENKIIKTEIRKLPKISVNENNGEISFNTKIMFFTDEEIIFDSIFIDENNFEINVSGKNIETYYKKLCDNPKIKNCTLENIFSKNQNLKNAIITGEFYIEQK